VSVARKDDEPESLREHSILQIPLTQTLNTRALLATRKAIPRHPMRLLQLLRQA